MEYEFFFYGKIILERKEPLFFFLALAIYQDDTAVC